MNDSSLIVIMVGVAFLCYALEKRVAWIVHVSAVCLIILVALILSVLGVVPTQSQLYDFFCGPAVPIALVLMVLGLNLRDVTRLPKHLVAMFFFGALATLLGSFLAGLIAHPFLGHDAFKLAAQLAASYTGGGENAVAMKKMIDIPEEQFVAIFAVDNVVTSLWIALTVMIARAPGVDVGDEIGIQQGFEPTPMHIVDILGNLFLAVAVVFISDLASQYIGFFHFVIYLSLFALMIGQIPYVQQFTRSAYIQGAVIFAGFFFAIGAMSDLQKVAQLPAAVIAMPFVVVGVHGAILFTAARFFKIPMIEAATVSQALIGGPATAVAVAQARNWKKGVSSGIILGVLGYAIGSFCGAALFHFFGLLS